MNTTNEFVRRQKLASTCQQAGPIRWTVFLVACLTLMGTGCARNEPESSDKPAPVAVRVSPATQQDLAQRIGYVGTVHSRREVKVLAQTAGAVTLSYGLFVNRVISFLIVAFAVFLLVKGMNRLRVKKEEAPAEPPKPREEVVLLKAILQTLKKQ